MKPPVVDGDQDQDDILSSSFSTFGFVILLPASSSLSTFIVKIVSVMDIWLPLMYMLISTWPFLESFATLDIHSQTSSSVAFSPGMASSLLDAELAPSFEVFNNIKKGIKNIPTIPTSL